MRYFALATIISTFAVFVMTAPLTGNASMQNEMDVKCVLIIQQETTSKIFMLDGAPSRVNAVSIQIVSDALVD